MSIYDRPKRRARRIAADEAHSWARNLKLGNLHAKIVLSMLTLYVDGDGRAFVAIPSLAEDCELSPDTVRRRLAWLEEIGAVARKGQWIDEKGNRNGDGHGRRTTDLIQLLYDADPYEIESRAAGNARETSAISTPISPSCQPGLNPGQDSVSPAPGLGRPSQSGEGLISEPEPEPESPLAPDGGVSESDQTIEPEDFAPAWLSWRGHEAMRRDLALAEFRLLSPEKQRLCRAAIPHFNAALDKLDRTRVPNFHLWIRSAGFEEFPTATLEAPVSATSFEVGSREGRAIKALFAFARTSLFENRGRVVYPLPMTAQVLAFADLPPQTVWQWIDDRQQIAAWSSFLSLHIHRARPDLVVTKSADGTRGMMAPWPWPPRKDGTISQATGDAA